MKKKKKNKPLSLKKPTLYSRVWKIWLYNIIWSAVFFGLFLGFYTIDELCLELDHFLMWTFWDLRWQFVLIALSFWFFFRQIMKDLNLIRFTYLTHKHDKEIIEKGGYKRTYEGDEGTGKTTNVAYDTVMLACDKDQEMHLSYYLKLPFAEKLENDVDFKVLKESFEFYEKHPDKIPHCMANFDIKYDGKTSYPFSMEYLDQKKRLAEGFVCGLTELGNILPNSWSRIPADPKKDKNDARIKSTTLSLCRQFFDLTIVGDEQRTGEIFLAFRALVTQNKDLRERKKVLRPIFLELILDAFERKVFRLGDKIMSLKFKIRENPEKIRLYKKVRKLYKPLRRWATAYIKLSRLIRVLGFYKCTYDLRDATSNLLLEEGLTAVISADYPMEFDTRGERFKYDLYAESPE